MNLDPRSEIIHPPPPRCGLASFTDEELERLQDLPSSDGEPLETLWHVTAMQHLRDVATYHYRARTDFFIGTNQFVYYNVLRQRHRDFRGPDFFFVWGVDRHRERDYYALWLEDNRFPNVVIELLSSSTAHIDRVEKRELYQDTWRTPEYFLCEYQVETLEGLRLNAQQVYEPIPANERGLIWSEQLQLWLGPWTGPYVEQTATWLRFYDADGRLVPTFAEAAQQGAEQAKQRAEQEKQRADAAEAETARLRRELEEMRQRFPKSPE
jgi:Uma2 family endonuclease